MNSISRLYLITPLIEAPSQFSEILDAACSAGDIAAVMVRLAVADERTQINRLKILAPIIQRHDAAVMVALEESDTSDIVTIAARGGADGIHVNYDQEEFRNLVDRLKGERSLGVGNLRSRDDAMFAGEMGADYIMFGEPRPDGFTPPSEAITERATWWAEIFETPCVVFASTDDSIEQMAMTGAEFIALPDSIWAKSKDDLSKAIKSACKTLEQVAASQAE
ncbi:thiamine phosphate synthase [Microvirga sp. W0021]|uniref:Thiamine phosphate synthase n=1 Tax=Hohaiivirga grylli TaxID=3133970 RepID=A0ABV0BJW7_9HYPH